jgi:hypothetical protein
MAYRLAGKKPSIKVERRSENFKSAKKLNHINVPHISIRSPKLKGSLNVSKFIDLNMGKI